MSNYIHYYYYYYYYYYYCLVKIIYIADYKKTQKPIKTSNTHHKKYNSTLLYKYTLTHTYPINPPRTTLCTTKEMPKIRECLQNRSGRPYVLSTLSSFSVLTCLPPYFFIRSPYVLRWLPVTHKLTWYIYTNF